MDVHWGIITLREVRGEVKAVINFRIQGYLDAAVPLLGRTIWVPFYIVK